MLIFKWLISIMVYYVLIRGRLIYKKFSSDNGIDFCLLFILYSLLLKANNSERNEWKMNETKISKTCNEKKERFFFITTEPSKDQKDIWLSFLNSRNIFQYLSAVSDIKAQNEMHLNIKVNKIGVKSVEYEMSV